MPIDRSRYPADWDEITARIRKRAGNLCERPGCALPNGAWVQRSKANLEEWRPAPARSAILPDYWPDPERWRRPIRIVLTVAHLDHDTTNNAPENLRAWCQLHHLRHDAPLHAANAAKTRARKRAEAEQAAGQERLW